MSSPGALAAAWRSLLESIPTYTGGWCLCCTCSTCCTSSGMAYTRVGAIDESTDVRNGGQCLWSSTGWSQLWSGWAVRLLTDDMDEDGEGGELVGFGTATIVRGEGGAGVSSASLSFLRRSAISARRAAISAEHEECASWGVGAVLEGWGPDVGWEVSLASVLGGWRHSWRRS